MYLQKHTKEMLINKGYSTVEPFIDSGISYTVSGMNDSKNIQSIQVF